MNQREYVQTAVRDIRNEAIEECAKIADEMYCELASPENEDVRRGYDAAIVDMQIMIAAAIRTLKTP